jgi:hypothetical protein
MAEPKAFAARLDRIFGGLDGVGQGSTGGWFAAAAATSTGPRVAAAAPAATTGVKQRRQSTACGDEEGAVPCGLSLPLSLSPRCC